MVQFGSSNFYYRTQVYFAHHRCCRSFPPKLSSFNEKDFNFAWACKWWIPLIMSLHAREQTKLTCKLIIWAKRLHLIVSSKDVPSATLGVECGEIRFLFFLSDGEQPSAWAAVFTEVEFAVFSSSDESWTLSEYSIPMLASVRHSSIAIFAECDLAAFNK